MRHIPPLRAGLGSGPGSQQLRVAAPSCRGHPAGLRQTGAASSPSSWDFIIEAVKRLDKLFTSSSTVEKFTGLNPAASPANGAFHSRVLIAAGVPVPWLQARSISTPIAWENHPLFVQSGRNRVRDGDSPFLLFHTASH